ncbi:type II secretion system F family protein [Neomicrococcus aestuarii]|uniref:Tight adherence protein B n=1 Tax=Neomicrococcus aestuarii TaxID=556325 RepID=A0A1L2ZLG5_9MICC|nr:type II secretion system F family protein [Neomicrococcus aestuarii]APF40214.1 type II secretion system protein F [Neomicrococcus aestuarii]MBB5511782.1 tight adherence protein B [Neomicrococcus aestuarii]
MSALLGLMLGLGLFLIWWSFWHEPPTEAPKKERHAIRNMLLRAGLDNVSPSGLLAACGIAGFVTLLLVFIFTGAPLIALIFGLFGALLPIILVNWRAHQRSKNLREVWPDVVDHLRSGVRAGLSLPEALSQLSEQGPVALRPAFDEFARDYRVSGRFDTSIENLRIRLANPVADKIISALKLTREVGGSDLGQMLGTLAQFLRDSVRTRGELEARQSWTVNAARLSVAAPWIVLLLMSTQPAVADAYSTGLGGLVLISGLIISVVCYQLMIRLGELPDEERILK